MKQLKILFLPLLMFMLLIPVRGSTFDVFDESMELVVEPSQDYVVIPMVDISIESMSLEIQEIFILEGRGDDYSLEINLFECKFIQADLIFNQSCYFADYATKADLQLKEILIIYDFETLCTNRRLNTWYGQNIDEGRLFYVNLCSTGNFLYNEQRLFHGYKYSFSEVLIC